MVYNDSVLKHLQSFWPNREIYPYKWSLGKIIEELPDFQVFEIAPNQQTEPWIYVSSGIGSFLNCEFFIISPSKTPEHIETLAMIASACLKYPQSFKLNDIIDIGRAWMEMSDFSHFLISLPYPYGQRFEYLDDIRFFWLLPISETEKNFAYQNSVEDLENLFDQQEIDFLNPNRPAVA